VHVLVVEDDRRLAALLRRLLEDDRHVVDLARDARTALEFAEGVPGIEAVVLDIGLPDASGLTVARHLREKGSRIPILMLTARDAVPDRVAGLDAGADDYLVKPFYLAELLARLRALIRRSAGSPHPVIAVNGIVIDTASKTVTRHGYQVPLTAREYALVELLALRRGNVVTRTMLYEHLCDETEDSLSKVVEVHISNIRKKLGRELITTRRGLGYIISA